MTRSQRLQRIASISRRSEQAAARSLAASLRELETFESQLNELRAYREEYRASLRSETASTMAASQAQKIRAFIAQVDSAIDGLDSRIQQCRGRRDNSRAAWVKTQQRAQALDGIATRESRHELSAQESNLQREIDDRAPRKSR